MEPSLSDLTFKGSITEAIAEAKQQKKLFVVYISGYNPESDNLAVSTWTDSRLAESVSKFCILLHLSLESTDAANFAAIYPQQPPPCITAIGYNGVLLWQYDGFVTADIVASGIEKAWLSLHIQETTATYLTAALASKNQPASETSDGTSAEQGSSSSTNVLSSPRNLQNNPPEVGPSTNHEILEESSLLQPASKEEQSKLHDKALAESSMVNEVRNCNVMDDTCSTATAGVSVNPGATDLSKTNESVTPTEIKSNHHLEAKREASAKFAKEDDEAYRDENVEVKKDNVLEPSASKSNDVHLNIRLPDGSSLQVMFTVMDSLRMVKDYVDENQTSTFGPYDLAIPYPRKVFGEQDLSKTLEDLDLFGRQTLIVVQHHRAISQPKAVSSLRGQTNFDRDGSSSGSNDGYWEYMKRILSVVNPFSYLGGNGNSSDAAQDSQNSMRQYSSNPSLQANLRATGRSSGVSSSNQSTTGQSSNSSSRQQTRPAFGSNIHTLKHDEDDNRFGDRNAFWNGNSTQYGGDNDGK